MSNSSAETNVDQEFKNKIDKSLKNFNEEVNNIVNQSTQKPHQNKSQKYQTNDATNTENNKTKTFSVSTIIILFIIIIGLFMIFKKF